MHQKLGICHENADMIKESLRRDSQSVQDQDHKHVKSCFTGPYRNAT
jgi:hypothetical protein